MMQDIPPPPPGFTIVGDGSSAPPPPAGFTVQGQQPRVQTRRSPSRANQPAPQAEPVASEPLNENGITDAEQIDALIAQGYTREQAEEITYDPGMYPAQPAEAPIMADAGDEAFLARYAEQGFEGQPFSEPGASFEYGNEPIVVDRGVTRQNGTVYTTNQDGQLVPLASEADWDSLPREERQERFRQVSSGRSPGYLAAAEQAREMGVGEADFLSSFTAPINDEVGFASGYALQGLENLRRRLAGEEIESSALEGARAYRGVTQENQDRFNRERPGQAIAGGILGGALFGPAPGAALPGLLGRLGQAGGIGAAYGAAEGDGVGGRIGSAAVGGLLGAGTAGVVEGIAPLARAASRAQARASSPWQQATSQERRVTGAINRALERDGVTPEALLSNIDNARPGQLPFEAGGENLQGLAEVMANSPGPARGSLLRALEERGLQSNNRVAGLLSEELGAQGNGFQALRQNVAARKEAADTGMAAIADRVVPLDESSVRAFRSGLTTRAVRDAAQEAIADLTPEGSAAANRLFGLSDQVSGAPGANGPLNPADATITIREAQDISYALKEAADRAYRGGFNSRGEALSNLSRAVRGNAREVVPEYNQWLTDFGDASEAIGAMRTGQNVFAKATERNAMSSAQLREQWDGWSQAARDNYRLGVGEAILDQARANGGVTALRRLLRSDEVGDRVRIAFGSDEAFERFMQGAGAEVRMSNVERSVAGGSPTARRRAGQSDLENQSLGPLEMLEGAIDVTNPVTLARLGAKQIVRTLPRHDRSIVGNDELNGLLGEALTDPAAMTRLLNLLEAERGLLSTADDRVRALGLLSAPGVPASAQDRGRGLLTASP